MRDYVRGLLGPVGRKNSWQIAEYAGHGTLYGLQRLLSWCQWDPDQIRDDLQDYVAERLGQPDGVLIVVPSERLSTVSPASSIARGRPGGPLIRRVIAPARPRSSGFGAARPQRPATPGSKPSIEGVGTG
jgi:hypothetical protein